MKKFYSPLRYPGGKSKLAKFVALLCEKNQITKKGGHYIEPYAGGASVALFLLLNGHVSKITINDNDRAIYAFWYAILNHTDKFISKIRYTRINEKTWRRCREIQRQKDTAPLFGLGFSTFFLNRTNVSGIIDGGMIGGFKQEGKYKIDCRFNKQELIKRIQEIAAHKDHIRVYNLDALDLIKEIGKSTSSSTIFYFDPPYYLKGESLYLNAYKHNDHKQVSEKIRAIKNARWIVSYDAVDEIKNLYKEYRVIEYPLLHTAHIAKIGQEVLFFSGNMLVPMITNPTKA
ncbi:MAG: DNA adenine methylase [Candidatus Sungbacteria bacterium]|nr:DNA adenine methylase [Candidatus Sungbacteria bacterium]